MGGGEREEGRGRGEREEGTGYREERPSRKRDARGIRERSEMQEAHEIDTSERYERDTGGRWVREKSGRERGATLDKVTSLLALCQLAATNGSNPLLFANCTNALLSSCAFQNVPIFTIKSKYISM